jgi:TRAP-type mannitol/chloroaromatic compound transport system substrate-binding protein
MTTKTKTGGKSAKPASRRKFLKASAVGAAGAATLGFPMVSRAQTTTLKMQGSWGSGSPFTTMAKQYTDRVQKMSGGRLKIDYLPSGAVVKAFQVQDACNKGVLDGAHTVTAYWYGKNKAASLFGTGPVFGANASQILAWIHFGGGKELYAELVQDILKLNLVGFFAMPMPTQPLGWFKKHVTSAAQMKGLKYRTVGLATDIMQGMGLKVTQLPGGEIVPALERGVIEAFEFNNPTADSQFGAQDVSKHYHMGSYHHTANYGWAMDQYSKDLQKLIHKDKVNVYRTDQSIMDAQLKSWDTVLKRLEKDPFFAKIVKSQKEWSHRVAFYDLTNSADYKLAFKHYFPGELSF